MNINFCKTCGASLTQKDAYTWECNYCHNTYSDNSVKEESEKLLKTLLNEQKIEQAANLRKNLYDAVGEKYTDSEQICSLCMQLKALIPDDFMASFYYTANHGTPKEICESIRGIDAEENKSHVCGIIAHVVKSMRSEYALPLQNLAERAYKNTNMQKFEELSTLISSEVQNVNAGMYETAVPRNAFIAYSSRDMQKVEELVHYLESNGLDCFVAARNLRHGRGAVQNYEKALHEAIENCECVVFVSSKNSRSMECDALRVELKHIKMNDTLTAPPEYRKNYSSIPYKYKMNRVEYRIDNERTQPYAEKVVSEFFSGLEYACSPEEVVDRIYNFDDAIEESVPAKTENVAPTKAVASKICVSCGNECAENAKFCGNCGGQDFVGSKTELELYRLKKQMAEQEKKIAEATKKNLELTNKLNSQPKPAQSIITVPDGAISPYGTYDLILKKVDNTKSMLAIKLTRETTDLGYSDAVKCLESAPIKFLEGVSGEVAENTIAKFSEVGCELQAVKTDKPSKNPKGTVSSDVKNNFTADGIRLSPDKSYDVILKSFASAKKLDTIKLVRIITDLELGEAKTLVETLPKTVKAGVYGKEAEKLVYEFKCLGASVEAKECKASSASYTSVNTPPASKTVKISSSPELENVCTICGGRITADDIARGRCRFCGNSIKKTSSTPEADIGQCRICGAKFTKKDIDANRCPICGTAIRTESTPAPSLSYDKEYNVIINRIVPSRKLDVITVVREATGLGLREAKELVESTPKAVKTGVPGKDAEEIVNRLKEAGAYTEVKECTEYKAPSVTPITPAAETSISKDGKYDVILKSITSSRKLDAIKVVREILGLSLSAAKDFVESTPKKIHEAVPGERAQKTISALKQAGATTEAIKVGETNTYSQTSNVSASVRYNVYLSSHGPNKLSTIGVLRNRLGLGLAQAKTLCEQAPCFVAYDLSLKDATAMQKELEGAKAVSHVQQAT